jgi:glyoxylase-like metal-dependent hydrolase (beta-lactamase superfamily II)
MVSRPDEAILSPCLAALEVHTAVSNDLTWSVLAQKRRSLTRDLPPGNEALAWVANSSTLICGTRDAVLVDTFLTIEQSRALADWVAASGRDLKAIYVTHPHGDHYFGLGMLLERFPHARAVATPEVAKAMREDLSSPSIDDFWRKLFPGEIPDQLLAAEPLQDGRIDLEGHPLIAVSTGRTDTAYSTSLHVPSLKLIVAGDVVYNGIHPYLAETDARSRREWIDALDRLDALKPTAVVAGHKVPENEDDPGDIGRTRQYLRDFDRLNESTTTPSALYEAMLQLYPDRANPGSLWRGANAAKQEGSAGIFDTVRPDMTQPCTRKVAWP